MSRLQVRATRGLKSEVCIGRRCFQIPRILCPPVLGCEAIHCLLEKGILRTHTDTSCLSLCIDFVRQSQRHALQMASYLGLHCVGSFVTASAVEFSVRASPGQVGIWPTISVYLMWLRLTLLARLFNFLVSMMLLQMSGNVTSGRLGWLACLDVA